MRGISKNDFVVENKENCNLLLHEKKCDKYDYLIAVACGSLGGLVDIFFVGTPGNSVLGKWSDLQADNAVKLFAKKTGWMPKADKENNLASAIGFLEKKFNVNYDQKNNTDVGNIFNMGTKNHHMKSLSHSPDIVGLFFSILNQFTSTASFISDGQLITVKTDDFELQGHDFVSKLFCGIANWFGHLMSDVAGSSGSVGKGGRGTGIVIPFYELFGLCDFGKFQIGEDRQTLATLATRAFQEGYDARFGMAMAIPVIITNLLIRLVWAIRQRFQFKEEIKNCIPTASVKNSSLRVMLLIGNGTLCTIDVIDAGVKSGGNALAFLSRLNLIAWFKLVMMIIKEICIRVGLGAELLDEQIDAYRRAADALAEYFAELEKIDLDLYLSEIEPYIGFVKQMNLIKSEDELNGLLLEEYSKLKIKIPWDGNFDDFMSNKKNKMVFE